MGRGVALVVARMAILSNLFYCFLEENAIKQSDGFVLILIYPFHGWGKNKFCLGKVFALNGGSFK